MTKLQERRTKLVIETPIEIKSQGRYRTIILDCKPGGCLVRLKGTRKTFTIAWETIYQTAARIEAEAKRREKREAAKCKSSSR